MREPRFPSSTRFCRQVRVFSQQQEHQQRLFLSSRLSNEAEKNKVERKKALTPPPQKKKQMHAPPPFPLSARESVASLPLAPSVRGALAAAGYASCADLEGVSADEVANGELIVWLIFFSWNDEESHSSGNADDKRSTSSFFHSRPLPPLLPLLRMI